MIEKHKDSYKKRITITRPRIAEQILQIIKSNQSDYSKWLPLNEVFQQGLEAGFTPAEIRRALDILNAEGFLEKQEDKVRTIPLN